ncbi:phospho-N-acetylmuramoyl-pentapeptide-transferase [Streptobacillus felis]|uniref:Phospho-N-acetylmuramoyl-pentapeptide-transferase n=1 Tax=Streptobacillus felis TaxID=1384509 RepID=A0A7Z0PE14_9FUSO|nr:phospho-N-acetylmuramoyl-pentapeptide-transferase [Streptobacillus felis]NYV27506.1 phospho-N-acetylmuramoyl-pentapeptide-transferase [Streptobacillus felis]
MFYYIQSLLIDKYTYLRVFKSISIRMGIAFGVALCFMILFGNPFIKWLKYKKFGDTIREDGPETHYSKQGTPTMGGLLIIGSILFSTLIAGNFTNKFTVFLFFMTIVFSTIGFYDDYLKLTKSKKGLSSKKKLLFQTIMTLIVFAFVYKMGLVNKTIDFSIINPLFKKSYMYIGPIAFFLFMFFVIVGTSNAVNLTDGLDGLVSSQIVIVSSVLMLIAYAVGHYNWAEYINIYYVTGAGEIAVFLASIVGGCLGFMWFNFFPAQVFMGDVGSLTIGGLLGTIFILLKQELLLPIMGIIFFVEALSVMIQVISYKKFKRRVFKMAPIHHHFEKLGMPETKVTIRFLIITIIACLFALMILKLR